MALFAPLDIAAFVTSVATLVTALTSRHKSKHDIASSQRDIEGLQAKYWRTRKEHNDCEDKLSALETEMVVLRKLLPGGDWHRRLGLDKEA
jgi:septal ring factor EnvC (AmiA/AmiB activator)